MCGKVADASEWTATRRSPGAPTWSSVAQRPADQVDLQRDCTRSGGNVRSIEAKLDQIYW